MEQSAFFFGNLLKELEVRFASELLKQKTFQSNLKCLKLWRNITVNQSMN